ncbi:hypothetical protein TARUN_6167 [Trichoderma arundinaceum]|uniref:Uncharacterized protein n=1 Tax=Trichoderma arundinaceum TaxID=490622 RepID=A0A395NJ11_TRIAR|nr:hypothetical protein TARUN_6167 [Trichoderma arundinaceum]
MYNKLSSSIVTPVAISGTTATTIATTVSATITSAVTTSIDKLAKPMSQAKNALDVDPSEDSLKPLAVRIAEAKLVDSQIPVSKVIMGHTGKSVARSYLAALDCLVPVETSISISTANDGPLDNHQSKLRDKYTQAMSYLTADDINVPRRSRLQTYIEKQESWHQAVEHYNEAQRRHQKADQDKGLTLEQQKHSFLEWLQLNGRVYRAAVQGKYMDWVVHGYKFNVEFNFGVVDVTSAMKRIENSKEAFRNLTLLAADGTTEYSSVDLTPRNWATLALHHILISHEGLCDAVISGNFVPHQFTEPEDNARTILRDHYKQAYENADADKWAKGQTNVVGDDRAREAEDTKQPLTVRDNGSDANKSKNPFDSMIAKAQIWNKALIAQNKGVMQAADDAGKEETKNYINHRIDTVKQEIEKLEARLKSMSSELSAAPNTIVRPQVYANGKTIEDHELIANKDLFGVSVTKEPFSWTRISSKVGASESDTVKAASDPSTSGHFHVGQGLWSAGTGESHSSPKADASLSLANLDVEVLMDCMLVEIERPWLHAELFADHELDTAPGFKLSPGHIALQKAVEDHTLVETDYTQYCSYPKAFVIASNVMIEFNGNTASLESNLQASATETNPEVVWGPFTLASSLHRSSKSNSKIRTQSTTTGMRVHLQEPQIIAWVQEPLPALPKPTGDSPALFGMQLAKVPARSTAAQL